MTSYTHKDFLDMLSYSRPQGSLLQRLFCKKYLEPVFGQPDAAGNYIKLVGPNADIAFMSHHDTVHRKDGRKLVNHTGDFVKATGDDCLGADCTTGVYIMLHMIQNKIPGLYIIHAAEEVGCKGSRHIVENTPDVVAGMKAAISFDRYGYKSVITHQMGHRTCSTAFAESLADILGLGMEPDDTGVYTDSNEYADIIPECTNVSVGYFHQHTNKEEQDLVFLDLLVDACLKADWSSLVIERNPDQDETFDYIPNDDWDYCSVDEARKLHRLDLIDVVEMFPEEIASVLESWGYSASGLLDDIETLKHKRYTR
jgi:hypothetical protein